jgi:mono/diheme cytochrome c family protein
MKGFQRRMTGARPDRRAIAFCAVVFGLLAAGTYLWVWSGRSERTALRADPADTRQVALGETVYRQHCASCHGARLEGQPDWRTRKPDGKLPAPPHDETGHTWHHSDEQLFGLTRLGLKPPLAPESYQSDMPAFDGVLTDAQIWAVLAFIKSTWPIHIRDRQERINEAIRQRRREKGDQR